MLEETSLQLIRTSSHDIQRGNVGTHQPRKEQARSRTNKDGKEYVIHHIPGQKNKQDKRMIKHVRRWKCTWVGHVSKIQDNRWTMRITTWKPYERKRPRGRPARRWRDELNDYWKGTIWQRIAQDRQMWKQHVEAFAQPRDTVAAQ